MRLPHDRRGVTVVLLVCLVVSIALTGVYFGLAPRDEVVPAVAGHVETLADYVALSAAEEALHQISSACNRPGGSPDWHALLRNPAAAGRDLELQVPLTCAQLLRNDLAASHAPFSAEDLHVRAGLTFDDPFQTESPGEFTGTIRIVVELHARWGRGESLARRLVRQQGFKVAGFGPPRPFDGVAFAVLDADAICDETTTALVAGMSRAVTDCAALEARILGEASALEAKARELVGWPCCRKNLDEAAAKAASLPAPSAPTSPTSLPALALPARASLVAPRRSGPVALSDLDLTNRTLPCWKALRAHLDTLSALADECLRGARYAMALLAVVPPAAVKEPPLSATAAKDAATGHAELEALLPRLLDLSRRLAAAAGRLRERVLVGAPAPAGSHLDGGDHATKALADATSLVSPSLLERLGRCREDLGDLRKSLLEGKPLVEFGDDRPLDALAAHLTKRLAALRSELPARGAALADLCKLAGKADGLAALGNEVDGAYTGAPPPTGHGLLHGWWIGSRRELALVLPAGSKAHERVREGGRRFDEAFWRKKALFHVDSQKSFDAWLAATQASCTAVNGVIFHENPVPLKLRLHLFRGHLALYSTAGFLVDRLTLREGGDDRVTLVTPGSIVCAGDAVQATLCATGHRKSSVRTATGQGVQGGVVLRRHPSPGLPEGQDATLHAVITPWTRPKTARGPRSRWVGLAPAALHEEVSRLDETGR